MDTLRKQPNSLKASTLFGFVCPDRRQLLAVCIPGAFAYCTNLTRLGNGFRLIGGPIIDSCLLPTSLFLLIDYLSDEPKTGKSYWVFLSAYVFSLGFAAERVYEGGTFKLAVRSEYTRFWN